VVFLPFYIPIFECRFYLRIRYCYSNVCSCNISRFRCSCYWLFTWRLREVQKKYFVPLGDDDPLQLGIHASQPGDSKRALHPLLTTRFTATTHTDVNNHMVIYMLRYFCYRDEILNKGRFHAQGILIFNWVCNLYTYLQACSRQNWKWPFILYICPMSMPYVCSRQQTYNSYTRIC